MIFFLKIPFQREMRGFICTLRGISGGIFGSEVYIFLGLGSNLPSGSYVALFNVKGYPSFIFPLIHILTDMNGSELLQQLIAAYNNDLFALIKDCCSLDFFGQLFFLKKSFEYF